MTRRAACIGIGGLSVSRRVRAPLEPSYVPDAEQHSITTRARSNLVHLFYKSPRLPQHLRNLAPARDCFSRIVSVLEGVLVTLRGAWGHPAMHSATAVRHRWRPAPAPAPCPGAAKCSSSTGARLTRRAACIGIGGLSVSRRVRAPLEPSYVPDAEQHSITTRARSNLVHLFYKSPRLPQHLRNLAPARDCFSRIVSVLEGVLVTLRGAWGHPAMHSATAVRHRWRPAPAPAPCPGSASRAAVHGQFASHGVVPPISLDPLPLGSRPCPPPPARQHAHGRAQP